MKQSKCGECTPAQKFEGSTSEKVHGLQRDHWQQTGHRRFIGIRGIGNRTYGQLMRTITQAMEPIQHVVAPQAAYIPPAPAFTLDDVERLVTDRVSHFTGWGVAMATLQSELEYAEDRIVEQNERIERLEGILRGFAHNAIHLGEDSAEEVDEEPEPVTMVETPLPHPPKDPIQQVKEDAQALGRLTMVHPKRRNPPKRAEIPVFEEKIREALQGEGFTSPEFEDVGQRIGCTGSFVEHRVRDWVRDGKVTKSSEQGPLGGAPRVRFKWAVS